MGCVYLVTNTVNGKVYVGKTAKTLEERWRSHLHWANRGFKGMVLYSAIRKYGTASFTVEQLCASDMPEELNQLEREYIAKLDSCNPSIGYNRTVGGDGGKLTGEAKQRLSESVSAAMTTAVRERISAGVKRSHTPEVRKRMSDIAKARDYSHVVGPWRGKTFSDEHRAAISAGLAGKKHTGERRRSTFNARKTRCKHGHEFTVENTYIKPTGGRMCKACNYDRVKALRRSGRCLSNTL